MAILDKYLNNKFLKTLEPLSKLSTDKLSELAGKSSVDIIPAGRTIFRQNEKDKRSYYLLSGQIELQTAGVKKSETIKAKTPEAKYPIAQQIPRPCTAKTKTNVEILSLDTDLLEILIESDDSPSGNYEVTEINSDDENGWMLKFLQSRAFLQIPTENIQKILMSMEEIVVKKGQTIVSQGENNDYYYIVKTGKCSVSRRPSPKAEDVQIAILAAGDGFGEEALITNGERNATVRMLEAGSLMRLTKENFISLLVEPLLDYIHLEELKSRVNAGDLLVDVRPHKDFMNGHLDGAVNTPLSMIRLKLGNFNTERNTIVYCNDASRSTAAAFLLIQHGISCSILKHGLRNSASIKTTPANTATTIQDKLDQSSSRMTNIIANLDAVTSKDKTNVTPLAKKTPTQKEQPQVELAHKKALQEKQKLEAEKKRLQQEAQALREKAEAEKRAAEMELQKLAEEAQKHKQALQEKQKLEAEKKRLQQEAQALREKAEAEKRAAERKLQQQAEEARKHQLALEAKQQAEEQAQALREKAEAEKRAAEREAQALKEKAEAEKRAAEREAQALKEKAEAEKRAAEREAQALKEKAEAEKRAIEQALQKQKEELDIQLKKQQQLTEESKQKVRQETEKIRKQAEEELAQLREELQKTRSSVEQRVKLLKEKEQLRAEEEIKSRQQHANEAIKNSIEKARQQAATDAEKIRQQALDEARKLQQEIELKKQQLETEAERIRLDAERDRAATLELARKQAQDIVLTTNKEAEYISQQRSHLDTQVEQLRLQTEAERQATLNAAKEEALNIVRKTAEEAQQLDLQRQKIEEEVSLIKAEATRAKEQTLELAKREAMKIRKQAEILAKQKALEKVKQVRNETRQQAEELEKQRSTMELNLKQAEEIRLQAEKEAEKIRIEALQSAAMQAEEIIVADIQDNDTTKIEAPATNFGNISIPGSSITTMAETDAKNLAQEIVHKLEKAESNRIKEQLEINPNTGLSLASASLKRRSDGRIILEGEEDVFIFKEPPTFTDDELSRLEASIDEADLKKHSSTSTLTSTPEKSTELPDFKIEEPDFDLVDELPSHLSHKKTTEDPISEFSDFELHQPTDIHAPNSFNTKRPAQRIVAIAASLFVAIGVGITFLGINSETDNVTGIAQQNIQSDNSFNATRVSGLATNNVEIDKKVMNDAEHEFEKLLSRWKESQQKQVEQEQTLQEDIAKPVAP